MTYLIDRKNQMELFLPQEETQIVAEDKDGDIVMDNDGLVIAEDYKDDLSIYDPAIVFVINKLDDGMVKIEDHHSNTYIVDPKNYRVVSRISRGITNGWFQPKTKKPISFGRKIPMPWETNPEECKALDEERERRLSQRNVNWGLKKGEGK